VQEVRGGRCPTSASASFSAALGPARTSAYKAARLRAASMEYLTTKVLTYDCIDALSTALFGGSLLTKSILSRLTSHSSRLSSLRQRLMHCSGECYSPRSTVHARRSRTERVGR
jgi:hypothetical protein